MSPIIRIILITFSISFFSLGLFSSENCDRPNQKASGLSKILNSISSSSSSKKCLNLMENMLAEANKFDFIKTEKVISTTPEEIVEKQICQVSNIKQVSEYFCKDKFKKMRQVIPFFVLNSNCSDADSLFICQSKRDPNRLYFKFSSEKYVLGKGSEKSVKPLFTIDLKNNTYKLMAQFTASKKESSNFVKNMKEENKFISSFNPQDKESVIDPFQDNSGEECLEKDGFTQTFIPFTLHKLGFRSELEFKSYSQKVITAIKKVHENKIIHKDIKPDNIFVTAKGNVKIGDFGLSTKKDDLLFSPKDGTPGYIDPYHALTGQSLFDDDGPNYDVYSTAITLLEKYIPFKFSKSDNNPLKLLQDFKNQTTECLNNNEITDGDEVDDSDIDKDVPYFQAQQNKLSKRPTSKCPSVDESYKKLANYVAESKDRYLVGLVKVINPTGSYNEYKANRNLNVLEELFK